MQQVVAERLSVRASGFPRRSSAWSSAAPAQALAVQRNWHDAASRANPGAVSHIRPASSARRRRGRRGTLKRGKEPVQRPGVEEGEIASSGGRLESSLAAQAFAAHRSRRRNRQRAARAVCSHGSPAWQAAYRCPPVLRRAAGEVVSEGHARQARRQPSTIADGVKLTAPDIVFQTARPASACLSGNSEMTLPATIGPALKSRPCSRCRSHELPDRARRRCIARISIRLRCRSAPAVGQDRWLEDCAYCPQAQRYDTGVEATKLMVDRGRGRSAKQAKGRGRLAFAWARPGVRRTTGYPKVAAMIREVKALAWRPAPRSACCRTRRRGRCEAGLDYYNHNLDTAPEFYGEIIHTREMQDCLDTPGARGATRA